MQGLGDEYKKYTAAEQQRLLASLAEQLKLPLLQISSRAELDTLTEKSVALADIKTVADMGIQLIEHYLLSLHLAGLDQERLEPVSLSAILHKTAHRLHKLADIYHCDLELDLAGHYPPVMAHPAGLEAAITSLGSVFIEAQSAASPKKRSLVTLGAHKSRWGLVAGAYSSDTNFNAAAFRRAKNLYGQAHQPLNLSLPSAGAGVFIADALFASMSSQLRAARYHNLNGLAATLQPSQQLALI